MKKIIVTLLLVVSSMGFAQEESTSNAGDTLYFNKWYRITPKETATRFAIKGEVVVLEDLPYYQMEFYKLDTVSKTFFKEEILHSKYAKWISRHGKNTVFWKNGEKKTEGNMKKGDKIGVWEEWYGDGTKMAEYEYFEPEDGPEPKQKNYRLLNFWNRQGELIVKDGTGNYFLKDEDGDEVLGEMLNYNKVGLWKGFRKNGSKEYEEIYKDGELVQGESWDEEGNRYTYITLFEKAEYTGGQKAIAKVIQENFQVPKYATKRGIEGRIYVYFVVNEDGKVKNIEVSKPLCDPCDQEAIRIVKLLTEWTPGKRRGQNTKVPHSLPFVIRLR